MNLFSLISQTSHSLVIAILILEVLATYRLHPSEILRHANIQRTGVEETPQF